jgi:hypothetical protein
MAEDKISFEKALKLYKKEFPLAEITMKDRQVITNFVKRYIPELLESKEEFFKVLSRF